jgi:hypothetical protein
MSGLNNRTALNAMIGLLRFSRLAFNSTINCVFERLALNQKNI